MDIAADYDEGWFDKDEQGWCARRVRITAAGELVEIHRSGDDNGLRPFAETFIARVGRTWPELALVELITERGPYYFDGRTGRLRVRGEQVSREFAPPPDYRGPGCLDTALALVAAIAAGLGLQPGAPPRDPALPAPAREQSGDESLASAASFAGADGCTWKLTLRDFPADHWLGPQLDAAVHGPRGDFVSLFVQSPRRGWLGFGGPIERYHLALAERDRVLAAWTGRT